MNDQKNTLVQWIIAIASLAASIIIYVTSNFVGYDEEIPDYQGEVSVFIHEPGNFSSLYITNVQKSLDSAKKSIKIVSRTFDTKLESFDFIAKIKNSAKKGVNVKVITSKKTNVSEPFFSLENIEYRQLLKEKDKPLKYVVSDFIIIDDTKFLHLSDFFEDTNFTTTNLIGIMSTNKKVIKDADRIFTLMWYYLSPEMEDLIPPKAVYWPYNLMPVTKSSDLAVHEDGTSAFLSMIYTKSNFFGRDLTKDTVASLLGKPNIKSVLMSASFFEMPDNPFMQNSLVKAALNNASVKILLSDNKEATLSLKSAGLIAPFKGVAIKIGPHKTNFPNYLIVDDQLFFASDSVTGRVFKRSLGIGTVIKGSNAIEPAIDLFNRNWNCEDNQNFSNYINIVYGGDA